MISKAYPRLGGKLSSEKSTFTAFQVSCTTGCTSRSGPMNGPSLFDSSTGCSSGMQWFHPLHSFADICMATVCCVAAGEKFTKASVGMWSFKASVLQMLNLVNVELTHPELLSQRLGRLPTLTHLFFYQKVFSKPACDTCIALVLPCHRLQKLALDLWSCPDFIEDSAHSAHEKADEIVEDCVRSLSAHLPSLTGLSHLTLKSNKFLSGSGILAKWWPCLPQLTHLFLDTSIPICPCCGQPHWSLTPYKPSRA